MAETAADRHRCPLHVIEDAGGDPPLDQPDAFLDALRAALDASIGNCRGILTALVPPKVRKRQP